MILVMHIFLLKEILLLFKKIFTAADFEAPNNTVANATATNNANNNALEEKSWFLKIMHHLLIVFQKLMVWKLIMQKI